MEITKAHWVSSGDKVRLAMPLTKINEDKRIVSGFASLDNEDSQDDVVTADASVKAFTRFRGNIREMHQPIAVGKMVNFREESFYDKKSDKTYNGVYVDVYVSKGAQDTWEKVLDGTLTGFSIGGNVLEADSEFDKSVGRSVRKITDYELIELSLVDNPANQMANIFSVEKVLGGEDVVKGIMVDTKSEITYYCSTDEIAKTSTESSLDCPNCGNAMANAGWFEYSNDTDRAEKVRVAVQKYLNSINEPQVEPAINEGGVDVAEDTVTKAETPVNVEEIPVGEEGKAQTEIDSSVESENTDVSEAGDEADKATEVNKATDVTEVVNAEDDLAKMFDELSVKIDDSLTKSMESIDAALAAVDNKVTKVVEELDSKVVEMSKQYEGLSEKFAKIKTDLESVEKSLSTLNDEGAVKKSGDLGGESETVVAEPMEKGATTSSWGGHFLGVRSLRD